MALVTYDFCFLYYAFSTELIHHKAAFYIYDIDSGGSLHALASMSIRYVHHVHIHFIYHINLLISRYI